MAPSPGVGRTQRVAAETGFQGRFQPSSLGGEGGVVRWARAALSTGSLLSSRALWFTVSFSANAVRLKHL